MSAEKIIEKIKKDTDAEIKKIKKNAEKIAKDIIGQVKDEADIESKRIIEDGKKQAENTKKIMISKAEQDKKRQLMNEREKIIEECFTKAHHKLSILSEDKHKQVVKIYLKEGKKKLGKDSQVLVSRRYLKQVAQELGLKVKGQIEACGGVVLSSADEKITLDYTFDSILKREKDKIRIKVGKLLFSS